MYPIKSVEPFLKIYSCVLEEMLSKNFKEPCPLFLVVQYCFSGLPGLVTQTQISPTDRMHSWPVSCSTTV